MDPSRELLEAAAREVFADTPVLAAYLYGSRARGDHRPDSDADIAVLLGVRPDNDQALELSLRYADRLERLIHLPVDAVLVLDSAPLRLAGRVLLDGVMLFSRDDGARAAHESLLRRQATDYEIPASRLDDAILAEIAAGRR